MWGVPLLSEWDIMGHPIFITFIIAIIKLTAKDTKICVAFNTKLTKKICVAFVLFSLRAL